MSCRLVKRYMGGSTSFNGTTSKIVNATPVTNLGNGATLFGWIKPRIKASTSTVITNVVSASDRIGLTVSLDGFLRAGFYNGSAYVDPKSSNKNLWDNRWHFFVLIFDGVNTTLLLDGVAQSGTSQPILQSAVGISIGVDSTGVAGAGGAFFSGNQANLGIVQRAITPVEAKNLYQYGTLPSDTAHFFPLSDLPSTYLDTVGGATGTGTATTYSPDVPTQLPVAIDTEARSSLSFDGVDDSLNVFGDNAYTLPAEYTYTTKLKLRALTGASQRFLSMRNTVTTTIHTGLGISSTGLFEVTHRDNTTDEYGVTTIACPLNNFVTVSLRKSSTKLSLHIAGQKVYEKNSTVSLAGSLARVDIGKIATSATQFFSGLKKSEMLHEVALTDQQIRDLHFSNIVPYKDDPTKLVLNLKLNEGAGTIAYDSSGNGNNATITGATWSASVPSKAREVIGGNLVKNGDFSYVPRVNVVMTGSAKWIDGTAGGSATNDLFKWYSITGVGTTTYLIDNVNLGPTSKPKLTISCDATGRGRIIGAPFETTTTPALIAKYGIRVKPSTQYTTSYYAETSNLVSGRFRFYYFSSDGTYLAADASPVFPETTSFTRYSRQFTTSASTAYVIPVFIISTAGQVQSMSISDISLTETTLPTRTVTTTRTTLTCP